MANIKKSFNFRNGIQVDEDNLLVTSTGLVAIGKTVPTEALDVIGNVVVSGVTSSVFTQTGLLTVTTLKPTEIIGAGVSIQSGIITNPSLDSTGIVTYYGDGQYLKNLPTSEWQTTNAGFTALSIYNTKQGTVGIATTNPQSTLQIGNNPFASQTGVGIASAGNIRASGSITANVFNGSLTGNVNGNVIGNLTGDVTGSVTGNVTGDVTGNADTATALQNARTIGGVSFDGTSNIDLPGVNITGNQNTSGTAANLSGSPSITVSGIDLNGNLDVSGNTTLGDATTDTLNINAKIIGTQTNNVIPFYYDNISQLPSSSTYHGAFAHVHSTGRAYFAHAGWKELVNKEANGIVGTGTEAYSIGTLGIGVVSPANDFQLRKTGNTELQITSDTGAAGITLGRESGTNNTNNAEIRYGFGSGNGANYSSAQSLDILNYGTGNFNYHLSANSAGAVAGDFHWHKGINSQRLMTLTGIGGSLGLGTTQPTTILDVIGDGSFSTDLHVGNNLTIVGQLSVPTVNSTFTGNLTGNVDGNVNATGFSTFSHLKVTGITTVSRLLGDYIDVTDGASFYDGGILGKILGIGTAQPAAVVDFSQAGQQLSGSYGTSRVFMLPPKVDSTQKGNLIPVSGAFIFNTSVNKLEFYDGSSWTPLEANSGGGEVNQFAFSNIAVSGQTPIAADAKQDTLTLVAGTNITITTDPTGDEVTINSTGGGGSVTINNNVNNNLLTASGVSNTINGESNLTWDGSNFGVTGSLIIPQTTGSEEVYGDNNRVILGNDLKIYSSSTANRIITNEKPLYIGVELEDSGPIIRATTGLIQVIPENDVYYNNNSYVKVGFGTEGEKIRTTGYGVSVRGKINATGDLDIDGQTNLDNVSIAGVSTFGESIFLPDNKKVEFGGNSAGNADLEILHTGASSVIRTTPTATGGLNIRSEGDIVFGTTVNPVDDYIKAIRDGAIELYYDGAKKLETTTDGVVVTGILTATSFVKSGGTSSQYLMADGSVSNGISYSNSDVDSHLNTSTANDGEVLSWNSSTNDYDWITTSGAPTNIISPVAYAVVSSNSAGSGIGMSWGAYNSTTGQIVFTFNTAQPDANYYVHTNREQFATHNIEILSKTTTGFTTKWTNVDTSLLEPSIFKGVLIVYASTPTISVGGGGSITIQDEGSALSTQATTLNFVGSGVVASGTGATKTITISGGGGSGTTINNNANNRVITGSNSANTLEAESSLTYDGTYLTAPSFKATNGALYGPIYVMLFGGTGGNTSYYAGGSSISDHVFYTMQSTSLSYERFRIGANGDIGLNGENYGTSGQVLTSNGAGSAASWQTVSNPIISSWSVTASGLNYRFTGPGNLNGTQNHPKLFLVRGQKYEFDLNVSGHPFRIRSAVTNSGGTDYTDGVTTVGDTETGVITFDVPMDAPDVLYYQCNQHPLMVGTIDIASPPKQIQDLQGTTGTLANDAYAELNITGYKAYSLFKIASNHDALVRVYVDDASRDADITRSEGQDPNPGIGLIAEARTSGGTVLVTPGAMGFNNDNPRTNTIYLGVTNRSGGPQQIQVTLTAIQLGE